ncbi:MAG: arginyltransferase [Gammaproteobacteria bacterium]|nr:arginyltransferase [Gammaproteobacteria bacterium]
MNSSNSLRCFISTLSDCGYLADRQQRNLVVDPTNRPSAAAYEYLAPQGFRRNGNHLYRPYCPSCQACTPVRIVLDHFVPSRSHKRNLKRNSDLNVAFEATSSEDEFYELFIRYIQSRHDESSMKDMSREDYRAFLFCDWMGTRLLTTRLNGELMSATLVDFMPHGFSAVYTFYKPEESARGLGTFAILKMLEQAQEMGLHYVNLGYWIEQAPTMSYKTRFKGVELAFDGRWEPFDPNRQYTPDLTTQQLSPEQ